MFDLHKPTAQDALDMIEADVPPLNFGTGTAVYRAAVKRLIKTNVPDFMTSDLSVIPMTLDFLEAMFQRLDKCPPSSKSDKEKRSQWKSRLRTIARKLGGEQIVRSTAEWDTFLAAVAEVAGVRGMAEQALIPVRSTLRGEAVIDGIAPQDMTRQWLLEAVSRNSPKKRGSLKEAAQIIDGMVEDLPEELCPQGAFGELFMPSRKRRSNPLPPRVSEELGAYIADRVAGKTVQGFVRTITVGAGIKSDESTAIYRQATGWMFDSLCIVGALTPEADIGLTDLARLDWLGKVAFEAYADSQSDEGETTVFPWDPIQEETIYNRTSVLVKMFSALKPTFETERADLQDPTASKNDTLSPKDVLRILRSHCSQEMTDAHKAFCRTLVMDEGRQRLLLNMHTICWADAQVRWKTFNTQTHHQQLQTMNLCVLAGILAIVVNVPLRSKTVMSLALAGKTPDLSFLTGKPRIELHIASARMKSPKPYDAVLEDTQFNQSSKILDWFIAGPRQLLLNDPRFLTAKNRQPDLLFCGIGRARYNRILSNWTEEAGMRMTTHMFRHATASIMVNCCGCPVEEVARMLGNTIEVAERQYVFHDLIKRRTETIQRIEQHRKGLADMQHPGRHRKGRV